MIPAQHLPKNPMWDIEAQAHVFLIKNNLLTFPLDINEAAQKLDLGRPVKVVYVPNLPDEVGGYTVEGSSRYYVFINKNHPVQRQRFSACHEFGHLFFGHTQVGVHEWNNSAAPEEKEADYFAANLLMPLDVIRILAKRHWYNVLQLLDSVQRACDVSLSAAAQRICSLGLFKGSIILRDGFYNCFRYNTPGYHECMGYKHYDKRILLSGKTLHIHVLETFPPNIPQYIVMG